ncbi:MAG TPA: hypothetical protein DDZ83_08220, partial [Nitrospinae bacterium]|nr:hypothetical protein [Nitrospinota bacterium]
FWRIYQHEFFTGMADVAETRVLSPCGVIGSGFPESSLERGLSMEPHALVCDGGSTDMGPASLGT